MSSPGVSFITTVLNEESTVRAFLESVVIQTRAPDEIIIVDGGSRDRTAERVQALIDEGNPIRLIVEACSVSRGRDIAIEAAEFDVIAISDAGCRLDPSWLEKITAPFANPDVDVVAGYYRLGGTTQFGDLCARLFSVRPERIRAATFSPSHRSVAYRKKCWSAVGGYPDTPFFGEDSYFNDRIRKAGFRSVFEPGALVTWDVRPTWRTFARQHFKYAYGYGYLRTISFALAVRTAVHDLAVMLLLASVFIPALLAAAPLLLASYYAVLVANRLRLGGRVAAREWPAAFAVLATRELALTLGFVAGLLRSFTRVKSGPR
ncbi:MAG: glycosyltransferase [Candidatus Hydrogenedentota bacterium]